MDRSKTAATLGSVIFFAAFQPYYFVGGDMISTVATKTWASLLVPTCVALGADTFAAFEGGMEMIKVYRNVPVGVFSRFLSRTHCHYGNLGNIHGCRHAHSVLESCFSSVWWATIVPRPDSLPLITSALFLILDVSSWNPTNLCLELLLINVCLEVCAYPCFLVQLCLFWMQLRSRWQ